MMRRAAILVTIVIPAAVSAASLPANQQAALRVMKERGDDAAARGAAAVLVQTNAQGFVAGAPLRDVPVNAKALKRAVHDSIKTSQPKFVDATIQAYVMTYSQGELDSLVAYYKKSARKRGKMDPALAAKFRQMAEVRAVNMAPLRKALPTDLYATYCGRAACDDATRNAIAAFGASAT
jgi:hypothetical protein